MLGGPGGSGVHCCTLTQFTVDDTGPQRHGDTVDGQGQELRHACTEKGQRDSLTHTANDSQVTPSHSVARWKERNEETKTIIKTALQALGFDAEHAPLCACVCVCVRVRE